MYLLKVKIKIIANSQKLKTILSIASTGKFECSLQIQEASSTFLRLLQDS